jgi:hypothetical protein
MSARTWQARIELPDGTLIETTVEVADMEAMRGQLERDYPGASIVLAMMPRHAADETEA